jgi:hypothetical protein
MQLQNYLVLLASAVFFSGASLADEKQAMPAKAEELAPPSKTRYAEVSDVAAVPYLDNDKREAYKRFLTLKNPRAFAIANTGNIGWAYGSGDTKARALSNCERYANKPCTR